MLIISGLGGISITVVYAIIQKNWLASEYIGLTNIYLLIDLAQQIQRAVGVRLPRLVIIVITCKATGKLRCPVFNKISQDGCNGNLRKFH